MRKLIPENLAILLSGLTLILFSCTPESCLEETEAFVKASFYNKVTQKPLTPDSVTIYGLNMDTVKLYKKALKLEPALIPLNASVPECIFIVIINGITDTVQFRYSSYPHLVSKECGYTFYHQLDTEINHTHHGIKHIYTSNSTITTINEENIRIYY
jgi:hypothetical protein